MLPTTAERPKYNAVNRELSRDPSVLQRVSDAIALVEEGDLLKVALAKCDLNRSMFVTAVSGERELSLRLARAMEMSADFLVDEAIDAARNEPDVMRARVIAENNRWAASKRNSKRYGDRIDLNVTQTLDISGTLLEAKQRLLRPVSDQHQIEDAQVIATQRLIEHRPPDSQSVAAAVPDIFSAPEPAQSSAPPADEVPDIFS